MMTEIISVFLGAIIGSVATGGVTLYVNHKQRKSDKECITQALVAEIQAHLEIVKRRHFREGLMEAIDYLQKNPQETWKYSVVISRDHSPVFSRNADKLGLLDAEIRQDVVRFYQLLESVICDIREGEGFLAKEGGTLATYQELVGIVDDALETGARIMTHARK